MPWTENSGNRGPWGQPPSGGGGRNNGGGNQPPDLEELLRQGRQRLRRVFPGGSGGPGGGKLSPTAFLFGGGVVFVLYLFAAAFTVGPSELGVVTRFGQYDHIASPGLNFHFPPVEAVRKVKVTEVRKEPIGFGSTGNSRRGQPNASDESLMLTGDKNIVDIDFVVQWKIKSSAAPEKGQRLPGVAQYLFNVESPERTVRAVAEAAMREVVGRNDLDSIITAGRTEVENDTRTLMQHALDLYGAGIEVTEVSLQRADPPPGAVIEAFRDVESAKQERETTINQARTYSNKVIPEAQGEAQRIIEDAKGYAARVTADARGQADRFNQIYGQYAKAKDVTRERLYLETVEKVLGSGHVIMMEDGAGSGVVPYLPLNELRRGNASSSQSSTSGGGQ